MTVTFTTSAIRQEIEQHEKELYLTRRYLLATKRRLLSLGKHAFPKSDEAVVLMTVGKMERWLQEGHYIPDSMFELWLSSTGRGDGNEGHHYKELVRFGIMHPNRKDVQRVLAATKKCLTKTHA